MNNRSTYYKLLITGGGIGGLVAALCLMKAGHKVEIYEQAKELAEIGAGVQISANAMHVLLSLGLAPDLEKVGVRPDAFEFRLYTGEVLQRIPLGKTHEQLHGAPYMQFHRADLHRILAGQAQKLDSNAIRLNHKAVGFAENGKGVQLKFENGNSAWGHLLIGADGLKSAIRGQIADAVPPRYMGDTAWRIVIPTENLPKANRLEQVMSVFMGPGRHIACYHLRGGELLNFVGHVETNEVPAKGWTVKGTWAELKESFSGWHQSIQDVIEAAKEKEYHRWLLHACDPIPNWNSARATLLGDAAHPMLPYLSQGAAMAIEDGAILARALAEKPSVPEALELYQESRRERTATIQLWSEANRELFHGSEGEIRAAFAGRDMAAERNNQIYSYNPLTIPLGILVT